LDEEKNYFQFNLINKNLKWNQISAGYSHSIGLTEEGEVYVWGSNFYGQLGIENSVNEKKLSKVVSLSNKRIVQIVGGGHHTHCVTSDGEIFSAGYNGSGQCAIGDNKKPQLSFCKSTLPSNSVAIALWASGFHTAGSFRTIYIYYY